MTCRGFLKTCYLGEAVSNVIGISGLFEEDLVATWVHLGAILRGLGGIPGLFEEDMVATWVHLGGILGGLGGYLGSRWA